MGVLYENKPWHLTPRLVHFDLLGRHQDMICGDCSRLNKMPAFQGVPSAGSSTRSSPNHPATFQASISKMAMVKKIGLTLIDPDSRNDMFITAPKNAAIPTSAPTSRPRPMSISPNTITLENHTWALASIMPWRK